MSLESFLWAYIIKEWSHIVLNPNIVWFLVEILIMFFIYFMIVKKPKNWFSVFFVMIFDYVYSFFEDILGIEEKKRTKLYITSLFFVILISNLLGVFIEIWWVWFTNLHNIIAIPTTDINFNIAMAIIWVLIVIYEQFKFLWFWKAVYEYIPILGKGYIPFERWKLPPYIDWPVFIIIKIFDIIISMFLWILNIIGHIAKVISLSFRLFWNMTSGWMLLWMLLIWTAALSTYILWFDFPIILPIILHLQWLLVALIQSLVFPLLIAIFIKVAKTE